ncbi:MAG: DinB family protein [Bacteroidota bacterium]
MLSDKIFVERYRELHHRSIPDFIHELDEPQLHFSINDANPIVWIYWHMLRTMDVGISRFVMERPQIYPIFADAVNFRTNLNGTGMSKEDALRVSKDLRIEGLINYHKGLNERLTLVLEDLDSFNLGEKPPRELIRQVTCNEQLIPEGAWHLANSYYGKSRGWFLLHMCLTHPYMHLGQMTMLAAIAANENHTVGQVMS